jgi:hypothetical protein
LIEPDYFLQVALIVVVCGVALGILVIEPWANDTYGVNTTSYYCVLTAYGFSAAAIGGLAIYVIWAVFFAEPTTPSADPHYGPDAIPEAGSEQGNQQGNNNNNNQQQQQNI